MDYIQTREETHAPESAWCPKCGSDEVQSTSRQFGLWSWLSFLFSNLFQLKNSYYTCQRCDYHRQRKHGWRG